MLPSDSHISKIITLDVHESVLHSRMDSTLTRVRSRFWVIRGRQTVKKVIKPCVLCKWFQGHTLKPRPIADLPSYRVCSEHPFDTTGIDYAGPLLVKDVYTEGSGMNKSYILLFACAMTRFVHVNTNIDTSFAKVSS